MNKQEISSTWNEEVPRGKNHNKMENKTTVSLYLSRDLVEKAKQEAENYNKQVL